MKNKRETDRAYRRSRQQKTRKMRSCSLRGHWIFDISILCKFEAIAGRRSTIILYIIFLWHVCSFYWYIRCLWSFTLTNSDGPIDRRFQKAYQTTFYCTHNLGFLTLTGDISPETQSLSWIFQIFGDVYSMEIWLYIIHYTTGMLLLTNFDNDMFHGILIFLVYFLSD